MHKAQCLQTDSVKQSIVLGMQQSLLHAVASVLCIALLTSGAVALATTFGFMSAFDVRSTLAYCDFTEARVGALVSAELPKKVNKFREGASVHSCFVSSRTGRKGCHLR
jgi:hypothetical protein